VPFTPRIVVTENFITADLNPEDFIAVNFEPQNLVSPNVSCFDNIYNDEFPEYLQPYSLQWLHRYISPTARLICLQIYPDDHILHMHTYRK
jgi:hypothetical protein